MTAASDLARSIVSLVRERPGGLWHVADTGDTTWFEVAGYVGRLLGRGDDFATPISTDELAGFSVARRPARSDLDTTKFASAYAALPPWRRALERLVAGRGTGGVSVSDVATSVVAVVVDYHTGEVLVDCVRALRANGVETFVVVENGNVGSVPTGLGDGVTVVSPGVNLGYGGGVNRGVALAPAVPYVLVSNPDVRGACRRGRRRWSTTSKSTWRWHSSVPRSFAPTARATRRCGSFRTSGSPDCTRCSRRGGRRTPPPSVTDPLGPTARWTGCPARAFSFAVSAFEEVGGFDERYFMFAEDMALCWQLREHGFAVAATSDAVVTHLEGVSRALMPRRMLIAHHRSALRFEAQTARGWRRALLPLAALVLGLRLVLVFVTPPKP